MLEQFERGATARRSRPRSRRRRPRRASRSTTCWPRSRPELDEDGLAARRQVPRAACKELREAAARAAGALPGESRRRPAPRPVRPDALGPGPGQAAAQSCSTKSTTTPIPTPHGREGAGAAARRRSPARRWNRCSPTWSSTLETMLRPRWTVLLALSDRRVDRLPLLRRHLARDPGHLLPDPRRHAVRRADGRHRRDLPGRVRRARAGSSASCAPASARWPACPASSSASSAWRSSSTRCTCRDSKSVLAGSLTLALLILPTVIRASEEAIRAVPHDLQGGGAEPGRGPLAHGRDRHPAGRAARHPDRHRHQHGPRGRRDRADHLHRRGQRRQAADSCWQTLTQPTPALPWNIYNLCHRARGGGRDPPRAVRHGADAGAAGAAAEPGAPSSCGRGSRKKLRG